MIAGQSVVVCAPTGAGKTAIAEAAAAVVLARGQRVIYTTPLKALSNQKLFEMRARFGNYRVGLQTGDGSLNAGGHLVIILVVLDHGVHMCAVSCQLQCIFQCVLAILHQIPSFYTLSI